MFKMKTVNGLTMDKDGIFRDKISVRVTVDEKGASISFSNDRAVLFQAPVEPIRSLLEFAIGGVKNDC